MEQKHYTRGFRGILALYLFDEAPSIGQGWRRVEVCVGNKKVRLKRPGASRACRISRTVFDQIVEGSRRHG